MSSRKTKKRWRSCPFTVKRVAEDGRFSGYGSVFGTVDSYGEVVAPGAFVKSLEQHQQNGTAPAMLWQHSPANPLGSYQTLQEDDKGLYLEGQLALGVQKASEAYDLLRMIPPGISGLSIGYFPIKSEQNHDDDVVTLTEVDLWEVSLVTFPANADAQVEAVRAALEGDAVPSAREVEIILRDAGFSRTRARGLIAEGYRGLLPRDAAKELELATAMVKRLEALIP